MDKKISKNLIKLVAVALIVIGAWYAIDCRCVNFAQFTPASIRDHIRSFGRMAPIIYILTYALNTITLFPPIAIISLAAGLAFGKALGALCLMLGAMLGTSCTFFISRLLGRSFIEKLAKDKFKGFDDALQKKGFAAVLFFRVIPLVPYEIINYAAGLSKIKFKDYFLATFLGLIPGVIISALFGGALGEIKMLRDLLSFKFLAILALLILAILIPVIYRYMKEKKT